MEDDNSHHFDHLSWWGPWPPIGPRDASYLTECLDALLEFVFADFGLENKEYQQDLKNNIFTKWHINHKPESIKEEDWAGWQKIAFLLTNFANTPCIRDEAKQGASWTYKSALAKRQSVTEWVNTHRLMVHKGSLRCRKKSLQGYVVLFTNSTKESKKHMGRWKHAGRTVAHILGCLRRDMLKEYDNLVASGVEFDTRLGGMLRNERFTVPDREEEKRREIMHTCHTRSCLRLACLHWGTRAENMAATRGRRRALMLQARAALPPALGGLSPALTPSRT